MILKIVIILMLALPLAIKGEDSIDYNAYFKSLISTSSDGYIVEDDAEVIHIGEPIPDAPTVSICEYYNEDYICYTLKN